MKLRWRPLSFVNLSFNFLHHEICIFSNRCNVHLLLLLRQRLLGLGLQSYCCCSITDRIRATVKMRIRQALQTLCCLSRNASRMSIPPSWTTHQTSIVPLSRALRSGKLSMPRGRSSAKPRLFTVLTVSIIQTVAGRYDTIYDTMI